MIIDTGTQTLNEKLKSALTGNPHILTFAIGTPMDTKLSFNENQYLLKKFEKLLKGSPYQYISIKRTYKKINICYFIIFNIAESHIKSWLKIYNQESFIFCEKLENNEVKYNYLTMSNSGKYYETNISKKIKKLSDAKKFFPILYSYTFDKNEVSKIMNRITNLTPQDLIFLKEYLCGKRVGFSSYMHYKAMYYHKNKKC